MKIERYNPVDKLNSALKLHCHIVKNTLPTTAFSVILLMLGTYNTYNIHQRNRIFCFVCVIYL